MNWLTTGSADGPALWARVEYDGRICGGLLHGDQMEVFDQEPFLGGTATGETISLVDARWLTPSVPSKMIGLWNNFHAAANKNGLSIPKEPLYFIKSPSSYNAHLGEIVRPKSYDGRIVYEGELGIVIGRECCAISPTEAASNIFGFTCVNDVTAFELVNRDPSFPQWARAKSFDSFGIFGPAIATGLDPNELRVRTLVDGRERQNYPVSDMIFSPTEIVSRLSHDMTLLPGDLIACGTSLGVLAMRAGAVVEVIIEGIGTLRNSLSGG